MFFINKKFQFNSGPRALRLNSSKSSDRSIVSYGAALRSIAGALISLLPHGILDFLGGGQYCKYSHQYGATRTLGACFFRELGDQ